MTGPAKRKGDAAERELIELLRAYADWPIQRAYGAGRPYDIGDLVGLPDCIAQVKSYNDPARAIRETLYVLDTQRRAAGTAYAVGFIRRPRQTEAANARWFAVMHVPNFVRLLRAATDAALPVARNPTR
jgi:hypothetical protein